MPTLTDITEAHSQRITLMTRRRDSRLRDAIDVRDRMLRDLPACKDAYADFENAVTEARQKQQATDAKAESARHAAIQQHSDELSDALAQAQSVRRDADLAAFDQRRQAEADAEHEFMLALAASTKPSIEAQRARAEKMEKARKQFDGALAAAQERFRQARDAALIAESRGSREAERSYSAASRVNEVSANAARATAEQALAKALAGIPEASAGFEAWRRRVAAILVDYKREESEEFERFHEEVRALHA